MRSAGHSGRDGELLEVAILGGGMAGGLLARQLKRAHPELRIGLFERSEEAPHKLGESMVELSSNYFLRKLGLSSYLYDRHYPKNGLRFLFDTPGLDQPLERLSELGSESMPFHPSFQIDRARLDADLLAMNAEDGVLVRKGVKVRALELGEGGAPHSFEIVPTARGSETSGASGAASRVRCRWLIDASGRAQLIAKKKELRVAEPQLHNASVWGRFEGVADIDAAGGDAFHARVRYTARRLSTVHFMAPGYWIWLIPLRGGITSVGLVCDRSMHSPALHTEEGFREFLNRHCALARLMEKAKPVDQGGYVNLAYQTRQFFSTDRWGMVGEAACFTDPFYSPGSDFIALQNDFLCDLIRRDLDGEAEGMWRRRVGLYDEFMRFRMEATMKLYRGLYPLFGSYDAMRLKWNLDLGTYYNLWVSSYMCDRHLDARWVQRQLRQRPFILKALDNFRDLLQKVDATLRAEGRYYENNLGEYNDGRDAISGFQAAIGDERSDAQVQAVTERTFNHTRRRALALIGEEARAESEPDWELTRFMGDEALL